MTQTAEVGDTVVFRAPHEMISRLLHGDLALDADNGVKIGVDVREITPTDEGLEVVAVVVWVGDGEEVSTPA